jgi:hypothetical protein
MLKPETSAHTGMSGQDTRAKICSCVREAAETVCLYNWEAQLPVSLLIYMPWAVCEKLSAGQLVG